MSKRVVVFNHKGGVSKTTTVYNLAWMLSKEHNVLVVDGDPQCNLSNLLLGDDFERYYIDETTKKQNLKDGVEVAFKGRPSPIESVSCYSPARAPRLHLLAGHANLSEFEAALTFAQTSNNAIATLQNLPGAFSELIKLTEARYEIDYTLIDLNPGLSAINQNLFLSSHAFIVPTNPDPFSLMAIDTLTNVLPKWTNWKNDAIPLFEDSAYPLLPGTPKFLGTLVQRFNIRNGRAARPYRDNIAEIKQKVSNEFFMAMQNANMVLQPGEYSQELVNEQYCLAEIPDFQGLLPKSYLNSVPVYELTEEEINETGPVLRQLEEKRDTFYTTFNNMATQLVRLINYA